MDTPTEITIRLSKKDYNELLVRLRDLNALADVIGEKTLITPEKILQTLLKQYLDDVRRYAGDES